MANTNINWKTKKWLVINRNGFAYKQIVTYDREVYFVGFSRRVFVIHCTAVHTFILYIYIGTYTFILYIYICTDTFILYIYICHTNLNCKSWYIMATVARVPYTKVLTLLNGTVQTICTVKCVQYNSKSTSNRYEVHIPSSCSYI